VTLLNRLNNSMEWAELPFGRQTLHHDWLLPYRGLQASLSVLSLGIELAHFLDPNCQRLSELENRIQAGRFHLLLIIGCVGKRWFWVIRASRPAEGPNVALIKWKRRRAANVGTTYMS
jgi:hypothetical protein